MRFLLPTLLCAISGRLSSAQDFTFTAPDPSKPIDVSKPVTIEWDSDPSDTRPISLRLGIHWGPGGELTASLPLAMNLSAAAGSYTWGAGQAYFEGLFDEPFQNPSVPNNNTISPEKVHSFGAGFPVVEGREPEIYQSESYALTGLEIIKEQPLEDENGAAPVGAVGAAAAVVAGLAAVGLSL